MAVDYRIGGCPRYGAWEPEELMQLPDELRECVFFIEASRGAQGGLIGTGFFVSVPCPVLGLDQHHLYAVTAKHVLDPTLADPSQPPWDRISLRLNRRAGGVGRVEVPLDKWHVASDADVAVWHVLPADLANDFRFLHYPIKSAADAVFRTQHHIKPGEDVVITGLLVHNPGIDRNVPIIRVGTLAAVLEEPLNLSTGPESDALLVEVRSLGGLSGSPAFVHLADWRRDPNGSLAALQWTEGSRAGPNYLLGLVHGYFPSKGNVVDHLFVQPGHEPLNTGISVVVPVERIGAIIFGPTLSSVRENLERELKKEWNEENGPVPALAHVDITMDRTADLMGKLLQVPKDEADEVHRDH